MKETIGNPCHVEGCLMSNLPCQVLITCTEVPRKDPFFTDGLIAVSQPMRLDRLLSIPNRYYDSYLDLISRVDSVSWTTSHWGRSLDLHAPLQLCCRTTTPLYFFSPALLTDTPLYLRFRPLHTVVSLADLQGYHVSTQ